MFFTKEKQFRYILAAAALLIFCFFFLILAIAGVNFYWTTLISVIPASAAVLYSRYYHKKHEFRSGFDREIITERLENNTAIATRMQTQETISAAVNVTVNFPKNCVIEEETPLSLGFSLVTDPVKPSPDQLVSEQKLQLDTCVSGPAFSFDKNYKPITLKYGSQVIPVIFKVISKQEGEQSIGIEIFQNAQRLSYQEIVTHVHDERAFEDSESPAPVVVYEHFLDKIRSARDETTSRDPSQYVIHVGRETGNSDTLCFTVRSDRDDVIRATKSIGSEIDILELIQVHLNTFKKMIYSDANAPDSFEDQLSNFVGIGKDLFAHCIPKEVRQSIQSWKDDSIVGISCDKSWLPWELFHDGKNFLSLRFITYRLPKLNDDSYKKVLATSFQTRERDSSLDIRHILNIIGGQINVSITTRLACLFDFVQDKEATVDTANCVRLHELVERFEDKDLIHFTCHTRRPKGILPYLQTADSSVVGENFIVSKVTDTELKPKCLVFINSCSSETPHLLFKEFNSFGWKFYEKGAGLSVGTLMSVPQKGATVFAEKFYRKLFEQNLTIGQSMARTKNELFKEKNFFPLFYCIYGNPNVLLSTGHNRKMILEKGG